MTATSEITDIILNADTSNGVDGELLTLTLPTSVDGQTWDSMSFEGESAAFVDMSALIFIEECKSSVAIGFDESNDWSLFPQTFDALFQIAADQIDQLEVQHLSRERAYAYETL